MQGSAVRDQRLGRYTLIRHLASGGMADVYVACASGIHGFEKLVTIKCIRRDHARDGEFVRMFLDEARLAAALHHPNIAQVFDVGAHGGEYFFAMEYIHGEDVRSIVRASRLAGMLIPLEHVIAIGVSVCAALEHAHAQCTSDGVPLGTVHRDVSPSNVMVSYDGTVKLVDFGVAKATSQSAESRVGLLKGKAPYMSPEQCLGEPLDTRSDLFSLGALLYELSTGIRAFGGAGDVATAHRIVNEDVPPPSHHLPGYPADLEAVILRAMRRDPAERHPRASAMQEQLEALARARGYVLSNLALARYMEWLYPGVSSARRQEIAQDLAAATGADEIEVDTLVSRVVTATVPPAGGPTTPARAGRARRWLAIGAAAMVAAAAAVVGWNVSTAEAPDRPAAESAPRARGAPPPPPPAAAAQAPSPASVANAPRLRNRRATAGSREPARRATSKSKSGRTTRSRGDRRQIEQSSREERWDEDSALPPP